MAIDKKISELANGAPAQASDEYVVARGAANYKLTLTNLAASMPPIGATTPNTGAFTTLSATGNVGFDGGTFTFNDSGADKDFRVEGDTDANLIFSDASTDRVGIGTSTPATKLDVNGTITATAVNTTTLDLTNLEVTNIKAKDGTAAMSIADSSGIVSVTANPVLSAGTANGVLYLNGSKVATSGSALTFDGTNFATTGAATAARFIPSGSTVPTNGIYLPSANTIGIAANSTNVLQLSSTQIQANTLFSIAMGGVGFQTIFKNGANEDNFITQGASGITYFRNHNGTDLGRIPAAGGFQSANSISVGNVAPTTSGAGITFPATQSASSDANTLDDYEEGTFTPVLNGATTTTYTTQIGRYTKIGRMVNCIFNIHINSVGNGSVNTMAGFPFTSNSGTVASGSVSYFQTVTTSTAWLSFYVENSATTAQFTGQAAIDGSNDNSFNTFQNGTNVIGSVTYFV